MAFPSILRPLALLVGLILFGMTTQPGRAQQRAEPFGTVEFRLAGTSNVNRNFLHEFWQPGGGAEATLATPFYFGFLELGAAVHRYDAAQDVPGFGALWLYAGWGLGADVGDHLRLEASGRVGNYHMSFDGGSEFSGVINESELALMGQARVAVRPVGPLSIFVSGSYLQAYTFLRLKLWYVSAGLSYRLTSPDWLKDFLR
jgi:hypothetical protein